jgi:hypothetical protein
MGAWGPLAFDNDEANDWAYELEGVDDLSLVTAAFENVAVAGEGYLEQDVGSIGLAACEVVARLRGRPGHSNSYTEKVDRWVAAHKIDPPAELIVKGNAVIDRILGPESELQELWEEAGVDEWRSAVADLRARMTQ